MLVVVFKVDFIPNKKTLVNITFVYSCMTVTKSESLSKTVLTTSPLLLSKQAKTEGKALTAAFGLYFNHL